MKLFTEFFTIPIDSGDDLRYRQQASITIIVNQSKRLPILAAPRSKSPVVVVELGQMVAYSEGTEAANPFHLNKFRWTPIAS
jgi:hypothetical protein